MANKAFDRDGAMRGSNDTFVQRHQGGQQGQAADGGGEDEGTDQTGDNGEE